MSGMVIPVDPLLVRRLRDLIPAIPECQDPAQLRNHLLMLEQMLENTAMVLARTEMELVARSSVSVERALAPFLQTADTFFRYATFSAVPPARLTLAAGLGLINNQPPQQSGLFSCRDVPRLLGRLREIDRRLASLLEALRQMEDAYLRAALRIRQVIRESVMMVETPPGVAAGPGLRATSMAERIALDSVRLARREFNIIRQLLQEALGEVVPRFGVIPRLPVNVSLLTM